MNPFLIIISSPEMTPVQLTPTRVVIVEIKTIHQNLFLITENDQSNLRILVYSHLENQRIWRLVVTATIHTQTHIHTHTYTDIFTHRYTHTDEHTHTHTYHAIPKEPSL